MDLISCEIRATSASIKIAVIDIQSDSIKLNGFRKQILNLKQSDARKSQRRFLFYENKDSYSEKYK